MSILRRSGSLALLVLLIVAAGCSQRGRGVTRGGGGGGGGVDDDDAGADDDDGDDDDGAGGDWSGDWYGSTTGTLNSGGEISEGDGSAQFSIDGDDWATGSIFCNFQGGALICDADVALQVGDETEIEVGCLPGYPAAFTLGDDFDGGLEARFSFSQGAIELSCRGRLALD